MNFVFAFLAARLQTMRQDPDRGATAVEYALMVALIAAVIVVGVGALGTKLVSIFNSVTTTI
jgi:pilus assembly protein Flp/PilA